MKIAGDAVLNAPADQVWSAILDPRVLVRTIPGCEQLEATAENSYAMTVTAGVASIKGTYSGVCTLSDLQPNKSLLMRAEGAGAPGTIGVDVRVNFEDIGDGTTKLSYDADAVVGGMVGGVGQRMLTSVSKRMAGTFFSSINDVLNGTEVPVSALAGAVPDSGSTTAVPAIGQKFTAPARATGANTEDLLKGVALGAGLVLLGVLAGAVAGRRRG
jgi:carbon monoxide dehydrogenase subunit G